MYVKVMFYMEKEEYAQQQHPETNTKHKQWNGAALTSHVCIL